MNKEEFKKLLEKTVIDADGNTTTVKELPRKYLGLYFTASWCGACHSFSKQFNKFYQILNQPKKELEVLTVSLDTDL